MLRRRNVIRHPGAAAVGFILLVAAAAAGAVCAGDTPDAGPLDLTPGDLANLASGGQTTVFDQSPNAFSSPARNLNAEQRRRFDAGDRLFEQNWVSAPAAAEDRDGLGPLFNAQSCASCHGADGRGQAPMGTDDSERGMLFLLSLPEEYRDLYAPDSLAAPMGGPVPDPTYGAQLQDRGIHGVPAEGRMVVTYVEIEGSYADGTTYTLHKPFYEIAELAYGDLHAAIQISPRVAPGVFGAGLLEAIPAELLELLADPEDVNGDGISGRIHMIYNAETGQFDIGRFGWKATVPSVRQQSAIAFLDDIGITSTLHPDQNCGSSQRECRFAVNGGNPEVADAQLDAVVFYNQTLAVPAARDHDSRQDGAELFFAAGCHQCHTPRLTTGAHEIDALSGQTILPYTDLLLHDMGPELSDGRPVRGAAGSEWRTPPLWGIGLMPVVNGHQRLLHDGRAHGVAEAILWHGGEANASREAFRNMSAKDRQALIDFINSL